MNWVFGEAAGVDCPECGKRCAGLDWVLDDAGEKTTGAKVFPCEDVIPMPPWQFGPSGSTGALKFVKLEG